MRNNQNTNVYVSKKLLNPQVSDRHFKSQQTIHIYIQTDHDLLNRVTNSRKEEIQNQKSLENLVSDLRSWSLNPMSSVSLNSFTYLLIFLDIKKYSLP